HRVEGGAGLEIAIDDDELAGGGRGTKTRAAPREKDIIRDTGGGRRGQGDRIARVELRTARRAAVDAGWVRLDTAGTVDRDVDRPSRRGCLERHPIAHDARSSSAIGEIGGARRKARNRLGCGDSSSGG